MSFQGSLHITSLVAPRGADASLSKLGRVLERVVVLEEVGLLGSALKPL